ncbi:MAG: LamG-like jellyroll fold domain-containing protein [Verrucomicrobiota bacterium]|nr:LamG-like jellyroll fold domain-containing protein [Verrucomicrobiota bacterium]
MLRSSSLILLLGFVFGFSYLSLAETSFKSALTFYVSFDKGTDADIAKGDNQLFTLVDKQPKEGNHTGGVTQLAKGKGLNGDALLFTKRNAKWLFYDGAKNFSFNEKNWSGTVSFWLKVDPIKGLDPGYVDPIQITPNTWNDASFFVDFNKDGNPRSFRLGAFADKKIWNPNNKDIPEPQRPLVPAKSNPFSKDEWTHVAFTWERFNTGKKDGVASLFLNGKKEGSISGWNQQFSWANKPHRILIGLYYMGLFDELACFNRALSTKEIESIHAHKKGLGELLR